MNALGVGDAEFRLLMRFLGVRRTVAPEAVDETLDLRDVALVIIQARHFEKGRAALKELIGKGRLPIISRFPEVEAKHG